MSASASGSSAANGSAHNRKPDLSSTPSSNNTPRAYTTEQKAAVIRVRRCTPTSFYEILGVEKERTTIDENGIKKAYRKLSLLTHPDKNGYEGADEAFKMVSRAFQILGDADKRRMYDQTGGDPDSRSGGGGGGGGQSPFAGFARSQGMRQGGFEAEISPEELFRQFFGGGGMGGGFGSPFGGGLFDTGPGFVFNMGGGPGVRVHQFGGQRPRRRPAGAEDPNAPPRTAMSALANLMPLLLLFILPLLSSLFGGSDSTSNYPKFSVDNPRPPTYTAQHISHSLGVPYYVEPKVANSYTSKEWRKLDKVVEQQLARSLNYECTKEIEEREDLARQAQGWFSTDQVLMDRAQNMEMKACRRMQRYGMSRY